jgi:hypothetical protein
MPKKSEAEKADEIHEQLCRVLPTWDLIDGLLDERPAVSDICRRTLLARMKAAQMDGVHVIQFIVMEEKRFNSETSYAVRSYVPFSATESDSPFRKPQRKMKKALDILMGAPIAKPWMTRH